MESITTKVRQWGNSLGVVLPKEIVDSKKIKDGSEVIITIEPINRTTVGEVFDFVKKHKLSRPKRSTQEIMNKLDKEFWPRSE